MQHQLVKVDKNGEINDESYRVNVRGAEIEQQKAMVAIVACKLRSNGMPVPLLRNGYSIFNGTKYR